MYKDEKQLIRWFAVWFVMLWLCSMAGGEIGLILFITGTALMLMYAYMDYRLEQARKNERKKVSEGVEKIEKAYQREAHDVEM